MAKRGLKIAEQHLTKANNAFISLGLTQDDLAIRVELSRSTVSNFLRGKPIYKENFVSICKTLKLDWEEITGLKPSRVGIAHLTELVPQLRQQVSKDIEERCSTMRIFDMSQPIELGKIYTQVNILEKIISRRRKDISELMKICNLEDFDRFNLGAVTEERIAAETAVTRHNKLFILGKPGAGKTTFLKHLAIQCNRNEFQGDLVPFFVTLKDFAETDNTSLLAYLNHYLQSEASENLATILNKGKALILLDGLDEVLAANTKRVIKEIETLSNKYPDNQYVITCRIAAKEYTFEKFTEVEIADFDDKQIKDFAENWFRDKPIKPETFLARLKKEKPIRRLVSSPLLLTLLCISFEELGDFPANKKELYEEGIDALLKKWDAKRGVQRDKVYKPLSVAKKEDLLSSIAWKTFAVGDYFFKQEKAERYISEYIRNLPGANLDDEALQGDSEIVLKNIEAQHGLLVARAKHIYSFSHLTFQEYFTAREIILVRQSSDEALQELVSNLFESRWREVFLLAVAMSPNAEKLVLLIKQRIDNLLADDEYLQQYLQWLNEKALQDKIELQSQDKETIQEFTDFLVNSDLPFATALYFDLDFNLCRNRDGRLKVYCCQSQNLNLNLDIYLYFSVNLYLYFKLDLKLYRHFNLNLELAKKLDSELYDALLQLKHRLPNEDNTNYEKLKAWWQANGKDWTNDFRQVMIDYRNIGHYWQFDKEQKSKLEQYYRANQLLTKCLQQDCYVSPEVRQYIEETLLLPIAEIKN